MHGIEVIERKAEKRGERRGRREGSIRMHIQDCQEFGQSFEQTLSRLMAKFKLEEEEAKQSMDRYWNKDTGAMGITGTGFIRP